MSNEQTPRARLQHTLVELMCRRGVAERNPLKSFSKEARHDMRLALHAATGTPKDWENLAESTIALALKDNPGFFGDDPKMAAVQAEEAFLQATGEIIAKESEGQEYRYQVTGRSGTGGDGNESADPEDDSLWRLTSNQARSTLRNTVQSLMASSWADKTARTTAGLSGLWNTGDDVQGDEIV